MLNIPGYVLHDWNDDDYSVIYRGLAIFWALPVVVLMTLYEAAFLSKMVATKYDYVIENIQDLPSRPDIDVYVWKGSAMEEFLLVTPTFHC